MSKASSGRSRSRRAAVKPAYVFGSDEYVKLQRPEARKEQGPQRESSLFQVQPSVLASENLPPKVSLQDYLDHPRGVDDSHRSGIH